MINTEIEKRSIISRERETLQAFQEKDEKKFTQYFAEEYVGVANDGIKSAGDEVNGMKKLDLSFLSMTGEEVFFPAQATAIVTYTMSVEGQLSGKKIKGLIYCSTTYVNRQDSWVAVLHTESKA